MSMTRLVRVSLLLVLSLCWWPPAASAQSSPAVSDDPCEAGLALYRQNNYLAAEPLLRQCLAQGESLEALLPLTMIAVLQGRGADGLHYGQRAMALDDANANVRYWFGRALMLQGDADGALAQWEAGLALDTTHVGILEGMARLAMQRGDEAKAYNLLSQLRLQGIDQGWLHRMLSDLARRKGLWGQSARHWGDVVRVEGETEANLVVLGELHILAGQSAEAVEVFRHAVAVLPSGATWGGLGEAWFSADRVDSAAVALTRAVALDPDNHRNRFNLANALEIMGDAEGAGQHFRHYVDAVPDDPVGQFNYGVHLERAGDMARAVARVEEAVRLDPSYIQAQVVLAQMYEAMGRTDDALGVLDQLASLDPQASAELDQWRTRLRHGEAATSAALAEGKVYLLHIVTDDQQALELIDEALAAGEDFAAVAARFSQGATAVKGGDIGWVTPADMAPALRDAIEALQPGATSPPVVAGGRTHLFKRIR